MKKRIVALPEQLVQEKIIAPIKNEDLTIEEQAEKIIAILQQYPDYREKIVQKVAAAKEISQAVVDTSAVKAADSPQVPNEVTVSLAKEASDKSTLYVLKETEIPVKAEIAIKSTLDDEKSKEEGVCILLRKLYDSLKDVEIQETLSERIQNIIGESDRTGEVNRELYKVIAKNLAIMYHERNGAMSIYPMEKIVPLDEMMRTKMPQRIEEEYIDLLSDHEKNVFNKDEVINIFLERIAKEVIDESKKQGKSVELFSPSDLGTLSDKQIENYLNYLSKYEPSLTDLTRGAMRDRLKRKEQEGYSVDQFIASVRELSEAQGRRYLSILSKLSTREMDTVAQCIESGFVEMMSKKKAKERNEYFNVINASIKKRDEMKRKMKKLDNVEKIKVVDKDNIPKVKEAKWNEHDR